ncbi:MAG: VOC family protein [Candidatus Eremiobacteraeota bacterium]|nr:VOC family protein [Candidatus Eremiobacteraeota bacterium]MBV9409715.1 VOC family protein [Candidatus Eremiobacteraeota bacterium]
MHDDRLPSHPISHFAINADDVDRARGFYEAVLGWRFAAWGPPNFFMIETGGAPIGSLQGRRELVPGTRTVGFECTVNVEDLDAALRAVRSAGGKIVMERVTIPTVGDLSFVEDTEGNVFGLMEPLTAG